MKSESNPPGTPPRFRFAFLPLRPWPISSLKKKKKKKKKTGEKKKKTTTEMMKDLCSCFAV